MWTFIQEQILGMKWLNVLIGNLLNTLGLDTTEKIGGTIQFFIYDVIKIVVLLCTLIFIITIILSYLLLEQQLVSQQPSNISSVVLRQQVIAAI